MSQEWTGYDISWGRGVDLDRAGLQKRSDNVLFNITKLELTSE